MDGISEVYVDLSKMEVTVNYSEEKLSSKDIIRKLTNIGYPLK
jgi:copper chaperone CopZ